MSILRQIKRQIFNFLLKVDSAMDSGLFSLRAGFSRFWTGFSYFMSYFKVKGVKRFFIGLTSDALSLTFVGLIAFYVLGQYALVDVDEGWKLYQKYSVTFYDKNNKLIGRRGIRHRDSVPLEEMPDHMILAALATEDRKFYSHIGVDPLGIVRALIHNIRKTSGGKHGASTITQQLAKLLFFSSEQTLERKIKEAYMALWLEKNLTKDEILNLYFDRAYMGAGNFGLEAAAQYYFAKSVREVTLSEAAMLAGLFKAPSNYAPHVNLGAARARANVVLTNMVNAGFMSNGDVFDARSIPASVVKHNAQIDQGEYFIDWAFEEAKKLVKDKSFVLHVKTTIDLNLQASARKNIQETLRKDGERYNVDEASLVSMEHDGAVLALVGGRDYKKSQFNRAVKSKRQPGSSFKPVVFLAALNNGFKPSSKVVDSKVKIKNWEPKNYNRRFIGATTLNNALVRSINTIPIKLAQKIGYKKVIATAKLLGIDADIKPNASLPLGTSAMSVLDLTGAYATIANGGTLAQPYSVLEIRNDSGDVIYNRMRDEFAANIVANPKKLSQLKYMLGNVVDYGTGKRAKLEFTKSYGKTGTTQGYRDAWFVGFTDHLVTGVWYGNDNYTRTKRLTGGSLPAATFKKFMTDAYVSKYALNLETYEFEAAPNLVTDYRNFKQTIRTASIPKKPKKSPRRQGNIISLSNYSSTDNSNIVSISGSKMGVTLNGIALEKSTKIVKRVVKRKVKHKFTRAKRPKKYIKATKTRVKKPKRIVKKARKTPQKRKITRKTVKKAASSAYIDASGRIVILGN